MTLQLVIERTFMLSQFSLRARLISAFVFLSILVLAVGLISFRALNTTAGYYEHVATINLPNTDKLGEMRADAMESFYRLVQTMLPGNDAAEIKRLATDV